jgi:hypothetical protein
MRGEVRVGRREGVGSGGASGMDGKAPESRLGGQGTRRAHLEHGAHGRDLGGVKAQRLVEGVRVLPSRREGMRCGARCGSGGGRAWGSGGASGMDGKAPESRLGGRARAGRTDNMPCMFVTLEVSKLSGWLNCFAFCRVERRACNVGRGADREAGGRGAAAAQVPCTGRTGSRLGGQGTRGAHVEHVPHVRDLGGVKAQRLVER